MLASDVDGSKHVRSSRPRFLALRLWIESSVHVLGCPSYFPLIQPTTTTKSRKSDLSMRKPTKAPHNRIICLVPD